MNICYLKDYLEMATYMVTILGVPAAIIVYFREKEKERNDREYGTYDALDDKYIEFLKLCLENKDLEIQAGKRLNIVELTQEQKIRSLIIYEILICLLERAFLMYKRHSSSIREGQWTGWDAYVTDWMKNENFREIWNSELNHQYDSDFLSYMNCKALEQNVTSTD